MTQNKKIEVKVVYGEKRLVDCMKEIVKRHSSQAKKQHSKT